MRLRVFRVGVVAVIGRNQRDVQPAAEFQKTCVDRLLLGIIGAVILQLQEEVALSEDLFVAERRFLRGGFISAREIPRDFARKAGAAADNTFMKLLQKFVVHTRLIIVPFCKRAADDVG